MGFMLRNSWLVALGRYEVFRVFCIRAEYSHLSRIARWLHVEMVRCFTLPETATGAKMRIIISKTSFMGSALRQPLFQ